MSEFQTPTTRARRYTIRDWWRAHKGQGLLYVHLGYWRELHQWPVPGRIFRWNGRLPDLWYYLKCRLWRRYHVLTVRTLPPTWQDSDERMLHAMFHLLEEVIFKEKIFEQNGYSEDEDPTDGESWRWALGEMLALWRWWTVERPAREAEYKRRLHTWSALYGRDQRAHREAHPHAYEPIEVGDTEVYPSPAPERQPDTEAASAHLRELDDDVRDAEDDAMLVRLVKVRGYLWT
jgi:hypothetical protein